MRYRVFVSVLVLAVSTLLPGRGVLAVSKQGPGTASPKVLAVETFVADIAQNVAGNRLKVEALLPVGLDPHSFEPTPGDVTRVAGSDVLIINGGGFEEFLDRLLRNAGGDRKIIDASKGLASRKMKEGEAAEAHDADLAGSTEEHHHHEGDPHFWLAPGNILTYVRNIQRGLAEVDPDGAATYAANADAYAARLEELDRWIDGQVRQIPSDRRLLVTNHESFGYFADRYGFKIVGTVVPGVSTEAAPSAQQLAKLIDGIKATGARAIFLETGANPLLARQVAQETGIKVVTDLYTHSTTLPDGPAPTYIDMMKYNALAIVDALK